ncbi:uncharacterized protein A4U43_C02F6300 [Asparagus officinalis]|uniref:Thioredoxin domain-containing protein n=1 Tax=Asparagus officinalis TaxID=4686 RepID=A0A5P1FGC4_ASPOF|nr:thioredoxin M-type, chloroplastic-like [Asparagus officinalis]ONK77416.1 uncharacterized protein A4U43_C02F6300 [Asparagus officinalis]
MALELACFQVSTISSSSTPNKLNPNHPSPHKERLGLRPKRSISSFLTTTSSSSFKHYQSNARANRFVCEAKNAVDGVVAVDDKSWDTAVMANEAPVIVEFWAPWCGPCRMIAPVIDELAKEYAGKIACYKVNTDDCPNIASKYGIRSIPTVLFFKNGEKKESVIGAVPKSTLSATLEKYI